MRAERPKLATWLTCHAELSGTIALLRQTAPAAAGRQACRALAPTSGARLSLSTDSGLVGVVGVATGCRQSRVESRGRGVGSHSGYLGDEFVCNVT